ncbi:heme ABC transporter ATP-binding protein [Natronococcus jeotgali]|uniref:Cobalamin import ATP-binding protein BtuD n=1 Tax=Natronococcus jeotgali DSM 18795 TaxID=1227498 RepID=L9WWG7_9EURY|nr:heme ABC transporter ATP-binding protein [Natronococcus jeotgali]ELY53844.1 ABC transporter-related protein [Natronococcus jeotgali DSM 18795]
MTEDVETPPATDGARLEVEDVAVSLGEVDVLEDVSLTVEPGEFVGLVGPNGAGKTTLLRAVSGALEPTRGSVAVDGAALHDRPSKAASRLVAVVPQDTTLSFSFDVRTVVEMGRYPHRSRFSPPDEDDRAAVDRALERTRTTRFADRPIDEVSGGERQRVVLARAIAQETPVLLLDEPTASLDVNHQVETLELVRELVSEGRTVVAAIHDLDLAARYCDRLVALAGGRVLEAGPPEAVLNRDVLAAAFDVTAAVTENPVTGSPTVTALPDADGAPEPARVHVVGSGATAANVLSRLTAAGLECTAGPVSGGDVAAEVARGQGLETLDVEPFAPLGAGDIDAVCRAAATADATVVADLEVGAGNLALLEELIGTPGLIVVERRPFAERNHAGERARSAYERCSRGAIESSPDAVLEAVREAADRATSSVLSATED